MSPRKHHPSVPIRGLMFDPARLTEREEFYFDLLEDLAGWGINTLLWHFVDDEGFVLKLDSHPELATPYAFSKAKMRRFIAAAGRLQIDVIPEVEALGHARFITSLPQYAHLADGGDVGFNAACPSHPDTLRLYEQIIGEVAELFDSPYLHAGLDEVNLSGCKRCDRRGRGRPGWWVYAQHAKKLHKIITGCGKRMIMWADHVEREPAMLKVLPKDIVLVHWQYTKVRPERIAPSLDAGFEVILAPALCHYGDVICPNADNFRNMDDMVALAARWRRRGVVGLVNTFWTSVRGLRDAYIPPIAYTGRMLSAGKAVPKIPFLRRFLRERFGLTDGNAARALWGVYQTPIRRAELKALLFDSPADIHAAINIACEDGFDRRVEALGRCAADLSAVGGSVKKRKAEFLATVSAARIAVACLGNAVHLRAAYEAYRRAEDLKDKGCEPAVAGVELDDAAGRLEHISRSVEAAFELARREWDRTRYKRDPKKGIWRIASTPCKADVLLGRLARCRSYSVKLAAEFRRAVSRYRRGGLFPGGLG